MAIYHGVRGHVPINGSKTHTTVKGNATSVVTLVAAALLLLVLLEVIRRLWRRLSFSWSQVIDVILAAIAIVLSLRPPDTTFVALIIIGVLAVSTLGIILGGHERWKTKASDADRVAEEWVALFGRMESARSGVRDIFLRYIFMTAIARFGMAANSPTSQKYYDCANYIETEKAKAIGAYARNFRVEVNTLKALLALRGIADAELDNVMAKGVTQVEDLDIVSSALRRLMRNLAMG